MSMVSHHIPSIIHLGGVFSNIWEEDGSHVVRFTFNERCRCEVNWNRTSLLFYLLFRFFGSEDLRPLVDYNRAMYRHDQHPRAYASREHTVHTLVYTLRIFPRWRRK